MFGTSQLSTAQGAMPAATVLHAPLLGGPASGAQDSPFYWQAAPLYTTLDPSPYSGRSGKLPSSPGSVPLQPPNPQYASGLAIRSASTMGYFGTTHDLGGVPLDISDLRTCIRPDAKLLMSELYSSRLQPTPPSTSYSLSRLPVSNASRANSAPNDLSAYPEIAQLVKEEKAAIAAWGPHQKSGKTPMASRTVSGSTYDALRPMSMQMERLRPKSVGTALQTQPAQRKSRSDAGLFQAPSMKRPPPLVTDTSVASSAPPSTVPSPKTPASLGTNGRRKSMSSAAVPPDHVAVYRQRIAEARAKGRIEVSLPPEVEEARAQAEQRRVKQQGQLQLQQEQAMQELKERLKSAKLGVDEKLDASLRKAWADKKVERMQQRKQKQKELQSHMQAISEKIRNTASKTAQLLEPDPELEEEVAKFLVKKSANKKYQQYILEQETDEYRQRIQRADPRTSTHLSKEQAHHREEMQMNYQQRKYEAIKKKRDDEVAALLRRRAMKMEFEGMMKKTQTKADQQGYIRERPQSS
eukprot:CAMPEP_0117649984 /NCGR_PEP_ID=MMETSP0804-20121206/1291_1 /TAXON_ID=1074897 /ORGANISM="Tetraselmis astigmatica, Strain CCMP880" /LENGTH=523 /DNA_ID=CAMNT_0005455813 /DNA_START=251 /DNA_END=1822 /DNA_ORIENTATION=+